MKRVLVLWFGLGLAAFGQEPAKEEPKKEEAKEEPKKEEAKEEPKKEEEKKPEEAKPAKKGEEIVVTAERIETPRRMSGETYGVIDAKDLEIRQDQEVQEAVRMVTGVQVTQAAGKGGITSLFIRGGESDHALVLLDGFEINADGGTVDLSGLTTDGVGRLEIVKGAGSSMWGAEAMSGVLQIITKRGEGPPRVWISSELGDRSTFREKVRFEAGTPEYGVNLSISRYDRAKGRFRHSNYGNATASLRADWDIGDATAIKATVRYVNEEADQFAIDPGPKYVEEDKNGEKRANFLAEGLDVAQKLIDEWTLTARAGRMDQGTRFKDLDVSDFDSTNDFSRTTVGLQSDVDIWFNEDYHNVFTAGADWKLDELTTTDSFTTGIGVRERRTNEGFYLQEKFEAWDRLGISLSGRIDRNAAFGTARTGRAAATFDVKETGTRPHASIGAGIKTPTMIESFSTNPFFLGNKNLDPERSRTFDAGIEETLWDKRIVADVTFFENDMFDLVAFTGLTPAFENAGNARARGVEASVAFRPVDFLKFAAGYTYQRTQVKKTFTNSLVFRRGDALIRRPDHQGFFEIATEFYYEAPAAEKKDHPRLLASLHGQYVGDREDVLFNAFPAPAERLRRDGYLKVDLSAEYWIFDRTLKAFVNVENVLDKYYEEIAGYPNDPIEFQVGVEFTFEIPKLKRKEPVKQP